MTGPLALPLLEFLLRLSPLATAESFFCAWLNGELADIRTSFDQGHLMGSTQLRLSGNGIIAFMLNLFSLQTNKLAGALTLTVAANLKQCTTILVSIPLFSVRLSVANGLGMLITAAGVAWYSKVELKSKGAV